MTTKNRGSADTPKMSPLNRLLHHGSKSGSKPTFSSRFDASFFNENNCLREI
jgi:hypothetical protein